MSEDDIKELKEAVKHLAQEIEFLKGELLMRTGEKDVGGGGRLINLSDSSSRKADRPDSKPVVTQTVVENHKIPKKKEAITIKYEGRTYSKFTPCKYKCGFWSSWADDYKKGDRKLHINPLTQEILGGCPKYES
ncbi:MAG: hypothetical protein ACFFG0_15400 [Candidatus Thorarchaeota archaeon]